MTPRDKLLNILTLVTITISLCVRHIRTSSISYSLTPVTAALHSALPSHQCVKYILYVRYMRTSIHKLLLTHAIAALHSAFMCITLQSSTRNTLPQITTITIHSIQCECFTSKIHTNNTASVHTPM